MTTKELLDILSGRHAIREKKSFGSTNPILVKKAIAKEEKYLRSL